MSYFFTMLRLDIRDNLRKAPWWFKLVVRIIVILLAIAVTVFLVIQAFKANPYLGFPK